MDPSGRPPPLQPANQRAFGGGLQIPASHNLRPGAGHRRAHSETFLSLPDDFHLESDPDFSISDLDFPSLSDESFCIAGDTGSHLAVEIARSDPPQPPPPTAREASGKPVPGAHLRSLSVDAAFFDGLAFQGPSPTAIGGETLDRKGQHRRSGSMDGPTSSFEDDSGQAFPDYAKKALPAEKLAELSLIDPKRAKRILANRQSAARSKERKIRYTSELEKKVQTLQTEATTLSAQLTLLQRDTTGLTAENRELKLRLQAMEQQAQLREALNDALREEVQRLRIATRQFPNANGNPFSGGSQQSVSSFTHSQQLPPRSGHHAQHHPPSQPQSSSNGLTLSNQSNDPMDFM